jgi:hypothetical protein
VSAAAAGSGRAALLNACALIPIRLTSTLLWLAGAGRFDVLWSETIFDEVERTCPRSASAPSRPAARG